MANFEEINRDLRDKFFAGICLCDRCLGSMEAGEATSPCWFKTFSNTASLVKKWLTDGLRSTDPERRTEAIGAFLRILDDEESEAEKAAESDIMRFNRLVIRSDLNKTFVRRLKARKQKFYTNVTRNLLDLAHFALVISWKCDARVANHVQSAHQVIKGEKIPIKVAMERFHQHLQDIAMELVRIALLDSKTRLRQLDLPHFIMEHNLALVSLFDCSKFPWIDAFVSTAAEIFRLIWIHEEESEAETALKDFKFILPVKSSGSSSLELPSNKSVILSPKTVTKERSNCSICDFRLKFGKKIFPLAYSRSRNAALFPREIITLPNSLAVACSIECYLFNEAQSPRCPALKDLVKADLKRSDVSKRSLASVKADSRLRALVTFYIDFRFRPEKIEWSFKTDSGFLFDVDRFWANGTKVLKHEDDGNILANGSIRYWGQEDEKSTEKVEPVRFEPEKVKFSYLGEKDAYLKWYKEDLITACQAVKPQDETPVAVLKIRGISLYDDEIDFNIKSSPALSPFQPFNAAAVQELLKHTFKSGEFIYMPFDFYLPFNEIIDGVKFVVHDLGAERKIVMEFLSEFDYIILGSNFDLENSRCHIAVLFKGPESSSEVIGIVLRDGFQCSMKGTKKYQVVEYHRSYLEIEETKKKKFGNFNNKTQTLFILFLHKLHALHLTSRGQSNDDLKILKLRISFRMKTLVEYDIGHLILEPDDLLFDFELSKSEPPVKVFSAFCKAFGEKDEKKFYFKYADNEEYIDPLRPLTRTAEEIILIKAYNINWLDQQTLGHKMTFVAPPESAIDSLANIYRVTFNYAGTESEPYFALVNTAIEDLAYKIYPDLKSFKVRVRCVNSVNGRNLEYDSILEGLLRTTAVDVRYKLGLDPTSCIRIALDKVDDEGYKVEKILQEERLILWDGFVKWYESPEVNQTAVYYAFSEQDLEGDDAKALLGHVDAWGMEISANLARDPTFDLKEASEKALFKVRIKALRNIQDEVDNFVTKMMSEDDSFAVVFYKFKGSTFFIVMSKVKLWDAVEVIGLILDQPPWSLMKSLKAIDNSPVTTHLVNVKGCRYFHHCLLVTTPNLPNMLRIICRGKYPFNSRFPFNCPGRFLPVRLFVLECSLARTFIVDLQDDYLADSILPHTCHDIGDFDVFFAHDKVTFIRGLMIDEITVDKVIRPLGVGKLKPEHVEGAQMYFFNMSRCGEIRPIIQLSPELSFKFLDKMRRNSTIYKRSISRKPFSWKDLTKELVKDMDRHHISASEEELFTPFNGEISRGPTIETETSKDKPASAKKKARERSSSTPSSEEAVSKSDIKAETNKDMSTTAKKKNEERSLTPNNEGTIKTEKIFLGKLITAKQKAEERSSTPSRKEASNELVVEAKNKTGINPNDILTSAKKKGEESQSGEKAKLKSDRTKNKTAEASVTNGTEDPTFKATLAGVLDIRSEEELETLKTEFRRTLRAIDLEKSVCQGCQLRKFDMPKCGRCKAVYFCTEKCMKRHWPKHKNDCKDIVRGQLQGCVIFRGSEN